MLEISEHPVPDVWQRRAHIDDALATLPALVEIHQHTTQCAAFVDGNGDIAGGIMQPVRDLLGKTRRIEPKRCTCP